MLGIFIFLAFLKLIYNFKICKKKTKIYALPFYLVNCIKALDFVCSQFNYLLLDYHYLLCIILCCIKKQRHHFANKRLHIQSYGFSSSHKQMGELNHKESWAPKNWFFWTVVLEKTLLRVPWTARRSNQSILKEISPEYLLEGLMLKLKLQYFGHLMRRTDSLEKTLMLGKIEAGRRRGWQRMRWLDGITDSMNMSLSNL